MRILFVDACQGAGKTYYRNCVKLISRMVLNQQYVCDTELSMVEIEAAALGDYLYELETSRSSVMARQNFEGVDMLFVVGDQRLQPWSSAMWNVNCLVRMCLRSNKPALLLSDSVFESLVFHLVSGLTVDVSLVNLPTVDCQSVNLRRPNKKTELFLDSRNGSLYAFNSESNEWYLKKHCGLVNYNKCPAGSKTSELKCPSRFDLKCKDSNYTVCQTQRDHYLFRQVPHEFVVEQRSKWRVVGESDLLRCCIGWSPQGISIVEQGSVLAVHFVVSKKQPETVQLLKNYVHNTLVKVFDEPGGNCRTQKTMHRHNYMPTRLEVEKSRQIFSEKLTIQNILQEKQSRPATRGLRPHTSTKVLRNKHKSFARLPQPREQEHLGTQPETDEFWAGPVIKIRHQKPALRTGMKERVSVPPKKKPPTTEHSCKCEQRSVETNNFL